jgi:flagellar hook-length control protein FliK
MPQRGRQPEPHVPIARPIAADVQALASVPVTSGSHELLTPPMTPVLSHTIVVAPTVATGSMLPEETATQIVQAIRLQVTQSGGEATIRLEPKHFGELSITVRVEQGQVNARLQAESPVVREYLQSHQNLLRDSLADQQLTLGKFEVAEPPAESRHGERRSSEERAFAGDRQPQRRRQPSPGTPFESFEVVV